MINNYLFLARYESSAFLTKKTEKLNTNGLDFISLPVENSTEFVLPAMPRSWFTKSLPCVTTYTFIFCIACLVKKIFLLQKLLSLFTKYGCSVLRWGDKKCCGESCCNHKTFLAARTCTGVVEVVQECFQQTDVMQYCSIYVHHSHCGSRHPA